jgi:hypothetical protein
VASSCESRVTHDRLRLLMESLGRGWGDSVYMRRELDGAKFLATRLLADDWDGAGDAEAERLVEEWIEAGRKEEIEKVRASC